MGALAGLDHGRGLPRVRAELVQQLGQGGADGGGHRGDQQGGHRQGETCEQILGGGGLWAQGQGAVPDMRPRRKAKGARTKPRRKPIFSWSLATHTKTRAGRHLTRISSCWSSLRHVSTTL